MGQDPKIDRFFVCIGAQKAGTTWLARVLSRHDEVFVTPVKEIHYFDHITGLTSHLSARKRRSRYRKFYQRMWTQWYRWRHYRSQKPWYRSYMRAELDDEWYTSLFKERSGKKIAGEMTPEYALIGEAGFRHLAKLAPEARVIFIMRNPVTRAWSQLLHLCRVRKLNAGRLSVSEFIEMAGEERFEALSDYLQVLDALDKVFPPGRVLLEFYEDIHADREAALSRVCSFLGVDFDAGAFRGIEKQYNKSQAVIMPVGLGTHMRGKYSDMVRQVEQRVGRIPDAWRSEFGPDTKMRPL